MPSVTDWAPSGSAPNPACASSLGNNSGNVSGSLRFARHIGEYVWRCDNRQRDNEEERNICQRLWRSDAADNVLVNGTALNNPPSEQ